MERIIRAAGRVPLQRTTLYAEAAAERQAASRGWDAGYRDAS
jgi:hypothetical protein